MTLPVDCICCPGEREDAPRWESVLLALSCMFRGAVVWATDKAGDTASIAAKANIFMIVSFDSAA